METPGCGLFVTCGLVQTVTRTGLEFTKQKLGSVCVDTGVFSVKEFPKDSKMLREGKHILYKMQATDKDKELVQLG